MTPASRRVLELLSEGKITTDEAERLLAALGGASAREAEPEKAASERVGPDEAHTEAPHTERSQTEQPKAEFAGADDCDWDFDSEFKAIGEKFARFGEEIGKEFGWAGEELGQAGAKFGEEMGRAGEQFGRSAEVLARRVAKRAGRAFGGHAGRGAGSGKWQR